MAAAGEILTAQVFNRAQPTSYIATSSATITLTTTAQDITDAEITLDTETDNAIYQAWAVFDINDGGTSDGVTVSGILDIDGVDASGLATHEGQSTDSRETTPQIWQGTLASAGSHTFKLQANRSSGSTGIDVVLTHTKLMVQITEVI